MGAKIKIYTTPTCHYCSRAKDYLTQKGVAFEAFDVTSDKEAMAEMKRVSGARSVPVICVGDQVIVGFEKDALDKAIQALG